ncbi:NF038122 family metalloprotease [Bradyrhizobium sp.]|uniref:NF038122 family metalloprotease n=1 Tax=Bradyrhizobium sp. TaxID=376 RepID=UPI002D65F353|nr:NF038122 family metalloprotease [Bradyrhizobium sp.]HZR76019.1 NF038122 family metalloprotease [Bradyrhizobium sp.]
MRSHFLLDPLDPNGDLGLGLGDSDFNFGPALPGLSSHGTSTAPAATMPVAPVLPDESVEAIAANASSGSGGPGSVVAETSSSGFTINLIFDAAAMAAPASFRAGIQQAAAILSSTITNKITVNIDVDYNGTGGGAAAGPTTGLYESYSSVRADLIAGAAPGDTTFNALPNASSIAGQSQVAVWNAQLKLFGLLSATNSAADGAATFATDINSNLLVGVALHELTHAMGRVPYGPSNTQPTITQPDIFDFYRFTSGAILIDGNNSAPAAYFSLDGGNTKLADFGMYSDASDFLNPANGALPGPYSNLTPNDPFNELYGSGTLQSLTSVDLKMLDALGFNVNPLGVAVVGNAGQAVQGGANLLLLSSQPAINDPNSTTLTSATIKIANVSGNAVAGDQLYDITTGGLVQNGSVGNGVTASWNSTTNTLTLSGTASLAVYDALLSEVSYTDTGTDTSSGSHPVRTVTWTVNDGTNSYSAASQMTIDRAPVGANDAATDTVGTTISAGAGGGVLSNDTDLDHDTLTVTAVSNYASAAGTVGSSLAGQFGHLTLNANGSYSYVADNTTVINAAANGLLHDSFTYTVSDGKGATSTATLSVAVERAPVVTTANVTLNAGQTVAASSLFTASDPNSTLNAPNGNAITEYQFWDRTSDSASGHFYFNGVQIADHTLLDVTAAQLSQVTFVAGIDQTALEVRAYDGFSWSAADSALWAPFTVNVNLPSPPVVTTANVTLNAGQSVQASTLFTVSDPNNLAITEYQFWDRTSDSASGHFYFNGVKVADHTLLDVTAAQLSQVTFVNGTDSTALEVRAYDGVSWSAADSALWAPFTVSVAAAPPPASPVVTTANVTLNAGQAVQASSLFTVSDPNNLAITEYQFWDRTSDSASGHFYFNGVKVADHTLLDVTAAQLSEVTFVNGTDSTALEVRAYDGVSWSAADSALWAPFTVSVTAAPPPALPVVTTANITENAHQTVAASSLFTVSDPNNLPITEYQFWDRTSDSASGHFYFNGVQIADHTLLDVTAAQLSQVTFVNGTDPTSLEVRAYDGVSWSASDSQLWAPFTVSVTPAQPPVVTTQNLTEPANQTLAASSLFTVSDPNNLPITEYQFWDRTSDSASGHFYFNGVQIADHTLLDVTAAQLSQVTFVTGTDGNGLEVRAYDGVSWSASDSALWAPFTVTITPTAPATAPAEAVTLSSGATVADNFVFAPNFGQATIANFNPSSGTMQIDHTMFATVSALLSATHDDVNGNAVITDAQHDTITVKGVSTAQLLAHQTDFHIV